MPSSCQEDRLLQILQQNSTLMRVLELTPRLNLPNWYLGAGAISQSVWNYLHGYKIDSHIKDYDLVYFDRNTSYDAEDRFIRTGKELFESINTDVEIRNQARVHLWYPDHFGTIINPYASVEDGIASWATTITCIGITKNPDFKIFAPYGSSDLFNLIVRPVKKQITCEQYKKKADRWRKLWPKLTIEPW